MCFGPEYTLHLFVHSLNDYENLTSPQALAALLQSAVLAGLALTWILVDYRHVLIPVTPINLVYPDVTRQILPSVAFT